MVGPITQGWYRRATDAPHIVHRVSGSETSWLTCTFDLRSGYPCSNGRMVTPEVWRGLEPADDQPTLSY